MIILNPYETFFYCGVYPRDWKSLILIGKFADFRELCQRNDLFCYGVKLQYGV